MLHKRRHKLQKVSVVGDGKKGLARGAEIIYDSIYNLNIFYTRPHPGKKAISSNAFQ